MPAQGSWSAATVPPGYRIVVISAEVSSEATVLVGAVGEWAEREGADATFLTAADDAHIATRIAEAADDAPDLVIGIGEGIVDVFARLTPQYLAQQFLVVGAQLPEPTENSTSVIWDGASFRGTGISSPDESNPAAVTTERAADAVAAGVASVLWGATGIVVQLP